MSIETPPPCSKIVIINGQPASGKDTLANELVNRFGFDKPSELRRIAAERGLTLFDRTVSNALYHELDQENPNWYIEFVERKIEDNPDTKIVLIGVRSIYVMTRIIELASVKPERIKLATLALKGSCEIRFDNAQKDKNRNRGETLEDFIAQEEPEYYASGNMAGISTVRTMELCEASFMQTKKGDYSYQKDALDWLIKHKMV